MTPNMSNIETLRVFVNERLSAATEEIFGAVERRITGYEDEIARQRRLLETILQPHVKLIRRDDLQQLPKCEEEDIEEGDPSEQQFPWSRGLTQDDPAGDREPRGLEDTGSLQLVCHEDEEDEDEDESPEHPELSPVQHQEDPREPDYGTLSRLQSSRGNFRRKRGRPRKEATGTHIFLKIRILTDPRSENVFTLLAQELKVPLEMQEAEFLDLLRSSFPQLADNQPFDIFITDKGRRLCPLELDTLRPMPKEIFKSIKSARSLYICLKQTGESMEEGEQQEELRPIKYQEDPDSGTPSRLQSFQSNSPRKRGRPRKEATETYLLLKIRILTDPHIRSVWSKNAFTLPAQELKVPLEMQEAEFLDLLRSSFPQLADNQPFDIFTTDKGRLCPLELETLSPKEIFKSTKTAKSLYIRLKQTEESIEEGEQQEELRPIKYQEDPDSGTPSRLQSSQGNSARKRGRPRKEPIQNILFLRICVLTDPQICVLGSKNVFKKWPFEELNVPLEMQEAEFLDLLRSSFPQLADNQPFDIFTTDRGRKLCPLELDTLTPQEIFKSINSAGAGGSALYIRLKAEEKPQTSEKELQLKELKEATSKEFAFTSACVTSDHDQAEAHTRSHINHIQTVEKAIGDPQASTSRTDEQMETGGTDDRQGCGALETTSDTQVLSSDVAAAESEQNDTDEDGRQDDRDEDWKPDDNNEIDEDWKAGKSLSQPKSRNTRKNQVKRSGIKAMSRKPNELSPKDLNKSHNPTVSCKVCNVPFKFNGRLIRHAWRHANNPEQLCGVCGEHFESEETLKSHLLTHRKHHVCKICEKSVLTTSGLKLHMRQHKEGKPYECDVCHKVFTQKGVLKVHMRIHTGEKPFLCTVCGKRFSQRLGLSQHELVHTAERHYGCRVCGKSFRRPGNLSNHSKIHTARERPYLCDICCKTFHSRKYFDVHMRAHTGEKPFTCADCGKSFPYLGSFHLHKRIHTGVRPYSCKECGLRFRSKSHLNSHMTIHTRAKPYICKICGKACRVLEFLKIHMRTHSGERPYQCSVCDKVFTQSHCLKTHMKSHEAGETLQ